ncbi:hypothetical protein OIV83_004174 [Microbotryomycetes sp. JL201]|nr:hypothetical protein OIV83_004174 [Microbotryomycetes sp. JL201]
MDTLDRRKSTYNPDGLPVHSRMGSKGSNGGYSLSVWRLLTGKTRSGNRLRIVLFGSVALALVLWNYHGSRRRQEIATDEDSQARTTYAEAEPTNVQQFENIVPIKDAEGQPVEVPVRDERLTPPSKLDPMPVAATQPLDVSVHQPLIRPKNSNGKYLAYLPHSGYHNQRISFENALTLAQALDRTLLVPPVWLGHAIPYISYDKLVRRLQIASKDGLERCKDFGEGGNEDPIPRECEGYWSWTLVGWDFLVDLSSVKDIVPLKDRWNMSEAWLEDELGLVPGKKGGPSPDVFHLKDDTMYQYRFFDGAQDLESPGKFSKGIDLTEFARQTRDYKLVSLGSMFGTLRIRPTTDYLYNARSAFRKAMTFHNPVLDKVTEIIRDRLGGPGRYYGLHLRVGDGVFQSNARKNTIDIWQTLCTKKMDLSPALCDEMFERSQKKRRASLRTRDEGAAQRDKRDRIRAQRKSGLDHEALPPLPAIATLADSPLASSMSCRGQLHTRDDMLPFNAPLFIATDSKVPTEDSNLAVFFDSFPCTFTLGDFSSTNDLNKEPVQGLSEINMLRNEEDKVPLAQFFYPQLDAQIAAWGRDLIGTPQSTFSRFAVDVLHQTYQ